MITAIIVDDEKHGRENLRILLEKVCNKDVQVVDVVSSVNEAFLSIKKNKPEVVFLDINMPTGNGFTLLENWDYSFHVVFVTAYDEYAIKAFRFAAIDYILKPINIIHLQQAVQKIKLKKGSTAKVSVDAITYFQKQNHFDRVVVSDHKGYHFIKLEDILYIEANGSYSLLHLAGHKSKIVSKPLSHYEQMLSDAGFCRVHRAHLINLRHVSTFNTQEYFVTLADKSEISVSQRKKNVLLDKLSKWASP